MTANECCVKLSFNFVKTLKVVQTILIIFLFYITVLLFSKVSVYFLVDMSELAERQVLLLDLFQHISEPATSTIIQSDASKLKGGIENNLDKYSVSY